jgi:hypothetical protein
MKKLRYLGIGMVVFSLMIFGGLWLTDLRVRSQLDEHAFQQRLQPNRPDIHHDTPRAQDDLITLSQLYESFSPILLGLSGIGALLFGISLVVRGPRPTATAKPAPKSKLPAAPVPLIRSAYAIATALTLLGTALLTGSLGWYLVMNIRLSKATDRDQQLIHHSEFPVGGHMRAIYPQPTGKSYRDEVEKLRELYDPFAFAATLSGLALLAVGVIIGGLTILKTRQSGG